MPLSPRLFPRILPKTRRHLGWRLSLPIFQYLPKVTPKAQTKDSQRLQFPNPRLCPRKNCNKKEVDLSISLSSCFSFLLFCLQLLLWFLKFVTKLPPFVLNLPCFKALINENYAYFLSSYDSHTGVDIISILFNT